VKEYKKTMFNKKFKSKNRFGKVKYDKLPQLQIGILKG